MTVQDWGKLIDGHAAALVLFAKQWCNGPEDVVHNAFLKLVQQRRPPRDPVAWLYRVVRNGALDAAKTERRRAQHEAEAAQRRSWFVEPQIDGLDAAAAVAALQLLAAEQREVVVAHLWGGLTFEQIADVAGCSASSAFRRYQAALDELRKTLGVSWPSHFSSS